MKILVMESSPHKHGSSNLLAAEFIRGATEAGHQTQVFDVARSDLRPCLGCDACGMSGPCVQKDGMEDLRAPNPCFRYGGICHAALLFRHVRPAQNSDRPLLQLQQTSCRQSI